MWWVLWERRYRALRENTRRGPTPDNWVKRGPLGKVTVDIWRSTLTKECCWEEQGSEYSRQKDIVGSPKGRKSGFSHGSKRSVLWRVLECTQQGKRGMGRVGGGSGGHTASLWKTMGATEWSIQRSDLIRFMFLKYHWLLGRDWIRGRQEEE